MVDGLTLEENMVDGLFFRTTLTGRRRPKCLSRGDHTT